MNIDFKCLEGNYNYYPRLCEKYARANNRAWAFRLTCERSTTEPEPDNSQNISRQRFLGSEMSL